MAVARILKVEVNDHGRAIEVFEIELLDAHGWSADEDNYFASLEEAKAWLAASGHTLQSQSAS